MDPSFQEAYSKKGRPPGFLGLEAKLAADRPDGIIETEHTIPLNMGFCSRNLIHQPSAPSASYPIIVLFYGGGYYLAFPEIEVELA
ncbi:hypothetical protein RAB80_007418 [Fusarium oxysporum f. sp. vasinfectum]|nr:hypothetical protein RAB80_007418 [Fusarium oxysporum f. sp. vasinfectum]